MQESRHYHSSDILRKFQEATLEDTQSEKGYFYLGKYQDLLYQNEIKNEKDGSHPPKEKDSKKTK